MEDRFITSFENLHRLYFRCRKNKRNTINQLNFEADLEKNLFELSNELITKSYQPSRSVCFAVKKPKLREIFAADFRDRIIHHLLFEHYERIWEPIFIYDSYSCRKGKGIHLAVNRLQSFIKKETCNSKTTAYCLKLDIKGFFMNIDKFILFNILKTKIKNDFIIWLSKIVIFNDCTQNYILKGDRSLIYKIPAHKTLFNKQNIKGLPIGNLTSQFYGNLYLNELDQYVKHNLKCHFYQRYVDDMILIHKDREYLTNCKQNISTFLENHLKINLNNRCSIKPVKSGVDFLGYIVKADYKLVRRRIIGNFKQKIEYFKNMIIKTNKEMILIYYDEVVIDRILAVINSYLGHFRHANTYKLIRSLLKTSGYLEYLFNFSKDKIVPKYKVKTGFKNLYTQYRYFKRMFKNNMLFFQVGCYYEFYEKDAVYMNQHFGLKISSQKNRPFKYAGFHCKYFSKYFKQLTENSIPIARVNQRNIKIHGIMERSLDLLTICQKSLMNNCS